MTGNVTYGGDGSIHFTPNAPGTYHWLATYTNAGSANNNAPVNTGCPNDSNGNPVPDPNEAVVVQQIPTDVKSKQSWFPNDTATVTASTGNLGANGTLDFFLYNSADCTGTAVYSERQAVSGGNPTEEKRTHNYTGSTAVDPNNNTVTPVEVTTTYPAASSATSTTTNPPYSWKVVYTPNAGDPAHTGSSSSCTPNHTETFSITYQNDGGH